MGATAGSAHWTSPPECSLIPTYELAVMPGTDCFLFLKAGQKWFRGKAVALTAKKGRTISRVPRIPLAMHCLDYQPLGSRHLPIQSG